MVWKTASGPEYQPSPFIYEVVGRGGLGDGTHSKNVCSRMVVLVELSSVHHIIVSQQIVPGEVS